jgi:hypothetical protein
LRRAEMSRLKKAEKPQAKTSRPENQKTQSTGFQQLLAS